MHANGVSVWNSCPELCPKLLAADLLSLSASLGLAKLAGQLFTLTLLPFVLLTVLSVQLAMSIIQVNFTALNKAAFNLGLRF
jgi:hypothetical protein